MDAWLLLRGLRTLSLRVERINRNAHELARFLESHPAIEQVFYPGLPSHPQHELAQRQMSGYGAVIAFAVRGGYDATSRFVSALEVPTQAVSLGGVDSLAVHTAAMWSGTMNEAQMQAAGIPPNFVRFSVGIEHIDDLKSDVDRALREVGSSQQDN
jgi:cystathionine beta-lyase/cystathionine gamma-synthase